MCVGATKCGTSWLHDQLRAHPDFYLRTIKEYHFFGNSLPLQWQRKKEELHAELQRLEHRQSFSATLARAERIADIEEYLSTLQADEVTTGSFADLLIGRSHDRLFFGDFTPRYSLLGREQLMRFFELPGDLRIVYLLRDPIDRFWSHVKMAARMSDEDRADTRALEIVSQFLSDVETPVLTGIVKRGDYAKNHARLSKAFSSDQMKAFYYERILGRTGFGEITDFLGASCFVPDFAKKVHEGQRLFLPKTLEHGLFQKFRLQYKYAQNNIPNLPERWTSRLEEYS